MKKLIISAIAITVIELVTTTADALKTTKVYPDYTITASIITTNKGWKVNIKIRDMTLKRYIKAWSETTTEPEDIDLAGNRSLSSFSHEYGDSSDIVGMSGNTYNYIKAYKAITYSVFMIAKKIQDAGLIPIVKYGSIDQISTDGAMFHAKDYQPTGNYRKAISVIKYVPDYYIYTGISQVMSEDGLSVDHWKTTFEVIKYGEGRGVKIWKGDETNVLKFDLSETSEYTKSEFIIISDTWLDAQKEMFVKTHLIITKMLYKNNNLLIEAKYGDIEFTDSAGVMLIDLRNGIIPDGTMQTIIALFPASFDILNPANSSTISVSPVTFTWQSSPNATSYTLKLTSSGLPNQIITTSNTYTTVNVSVSSTPRWYYWSVYAINDYGQTQSSSTQWFITQQ